SPHPKRDGERLETAKVSDVEADSVVARELDRVAVLSLDDLVRACIEALEVEVRDATWDLELARSSAKPFGESLAARRDGRLERTLRSGDPRLDVRDPRLGGIIGKEEGRRRHGGREEGIEACFVDLIEEREELVVLLLRDRIVLVVVAAGTLERQPEEGRGDRVRPVGDVLDTELLWNAST